MSVFLLIKWIHVLSASLWVGGIIFTIIVNRGLRRAVGPRDATKMLGVIGRVIQLPMRASLYIAIATGLLLLVIRGVGPLTLFDSMFYITPLGSYLLLKIIAVLMILALIPLHSKYGAEVARSNQDERGYVKARYGVLLVGWATFLLSVLVMYLGSGMRLS